jgi:hypothetical protein
MLDRRQNEWVGSGIRIGQVRVALTVASFCAARMYTGVEVMRRSAFHGAPLYQRQCIIAYTENN